MSPRARILLPIALILLVGLSVYRLVLAPPPGPYIELGGSTMGTSYSVKLAAELGPEAQRAVAMAIRERLARVDALMSTWRPDSELSRFNEAPGGTPFPVAPETLQVFEIAAETSRRSGGAFDVTVGPLVDAWGFGAPGRAATPPAPEVLAALRDRVGYAGISIDRQRQTLSKRNAATRCDLSAIAKGFAVDEVARALEALGHGDYLVEIGGELRARGRRGDGTIWRVAIERPEDGAERHVLEILPLENAALATSGDYRNYYEHPDDRSRLSHTIDPRTARPISHRLASVSVLHEEAVRADAWATALNVLGPEDGYNLAVDQGLAALFIVRTNEAGFTVRTSPAFEPYRSTVPAAPSME